jgi:ketosteroid isomerase-like protein
VHPNVELLERFYTGLQRSDIAAVRACYAPDVVYSDPVFRELRGDRALAMWEMIFSRDEPMEVSFSDISADDETGSGRWEARYVFTKSGREVRNAIDSRFRFAGGRIVEHRDTFSVYKWASMALGPVGRLAGWSPPLRASLHKESAKMLDRFQASSAPGSGDKQDAGGAS